MRFFDTMKRLIADEQGAEIVEYVLVAGLIIIAAIAIITTFGSKVVARWARVSDGL